MHSIKQACEQYIKVPGEDVRLIVDGGVENNNNTVNDYISSEQVSVQKLIAGKDIRFSNSMIEAQNKIIKYHYLFKHDFRDIHDCFHCPKVKINHFYPLSVTPGSPSTPAGPAALPGAALTCCGCCSGRSYLGIVDLKYRPVT